MSTTWHLRSRKKATGGRLSQIRKKKKSDRGIHFLETRIGKRQAKSKRVRGGGTKLKLVSADFINVSDSRGRPSASSSFSDPPPGPVNSPVSASAPSAAGLPASNSSAPGDARVGSSSTESAWPGAGRGCVAGELSNVLVFLASEESSYLTGEAIEVSGGASLFTF